MSLLYLACLLAALAALALLDRRFHLVLWRAPQRTPRPTLQRTPPRTRQRTPRRTPRRTSPRTPLPAILALAAGLVFFLAWDLAGIAAGVFARGTSPALSGLDLAPELPVEEVFFLLFLGYLTLILLTGVRALLDHRSRGRDR